MQHFKFSLTCQHKTNLLWYHSLEIKLENGCDCSLHSRLLIFSVTGLLPVGLETAAQAPSMRRDQSPLMLYFSSWWESRCGSAQANKSAGTGCGSVFQSIWERVWALRSWLDTKCSSEARLMKLHGAPQERFTEPFSREEIWNLL